MEPVTLAVAVLIAFGTLSLFVVLLVVAHLVDSR